MISVRRQATPGLRPGDTGISEKIGLNVRILPAEEEAQFQVYKTVMPWTIKA
jgi:hypothetical protein